MRAYWVAIGTIAASLSQTVCASAPVEKYHVSPARISSSALKSAIGILTLNSGSKGGSELQCYVLKAKKLVPSGLLKSRQITPVSSYSSPEMRVESEMTNWRF